jgi:hypothetical protein
MVGKLINWKEPGRILLWNVTPFPQELCKNHKRELVIMTNQMGTEQLPNASLVLQP